LVNIKNNALILLSSLADLESWLPWPQFYIRCPSKRSELCWLLYWWWQTLSNYWFWWSHCQGLFSIFCFFFFFFCLFFIFFSIFFFWL